MDNEKMAGYLIGEEGPLSGQTFSFEEGDEWILGRDPDEATIILEDPMVSRKHAICRETPEGFFLENLSSVNPITQNGKVVEDAVLLREEDILQIGSTFFRFTELAPIQEKISDSYGIDHNADLTSFRMDMPQETRWLLKVISGPNAGAEFSMQREHSYTLGKDPAICDIVFQDLSVSRQHALLSIDEEEKAFLEDLGSKNGILVNGIHIAQKTELASQDMVAIGTTSFLVLDKNEVRDTIISAATQTVPKREEEHEMAAPAHMEAVAFPSKDWKEMVIARKHLVILGICAVFLIGFLSLFLGLFNATTVAVNEKNEPEHIQETIKGYPAIQFSFNASSGKLFINGHVLTGVEKQELFYLLKTLPYIRSIDDNVVVDEYVWQNMNALLVTNPNWQGVSLYSPTPGRFVLRGYLQTTEQAGALADYVNLNFPYLDRLENQVVVENTLNTQIGSLLLEKGYGGVTFQLSNGDVVFQGAVDTAQTEAFTHFITHIKNVPGIRSVKNFVVYTSRDSARIDISSQYQVSGASKKDGTGNSVVINGKILTVGDSLDGMYISAIHSDAVLLEKDGLKFKINYNLQ